MNLPRAVFPWLTDPSAVCAVTTELPHGWAEMRHPRANLTLTVAPDGTRYLWALDNDAHAEFENADAVIEVVFVVIARATGERHERTRITPLMLLARLDPRL